MLFFIIWFSTFSHVLFHFTKEFLRYLYELYTNMTTTTVSMGKTRPLRPELNFNFQRAQFKIWKESGLN